MSKLLNKPLKVFIAFACIILVCSIPVYFFLVESIWIDELDDHNQFVKEQLKKGFHGLSSADLENSLSLWNRIQPESQLSRTAKTVKDSVYILEKEMMDNGKMEMERFRALRSTIRLNGKLYLVTIKTNIEEVHETVSAIALITCCFIALLITGFIMLNRHLSKRIWQPFADTLDKLQQFDLNSSDKINFETTNIQEFAALNNVLAKMIDNNMRIYRQQKEFTENASHELQTPLAILKSKIDILIQDPSLTIPQRQLIEALNYSISRMSRINKNLLLLAGIENNEYVTEKIQLSILLPSLINNLSDVADNKSCSILTNIEVGVEVNGNDNLVEIMITNLLSNAVRHSTHHCKITVALNKYQLIITNTGTSPLNKNNLFKRFISVTPETTGTGLGLAIVKEICDRYNWKVNYSHQDTVHIFSVSF